MHRARAGLGDHQIAARHEIVERVLPDRHVGTVAEYLADQLAAYNQLLLQGRVARKAGNVQVSITIFESALRLRQSDDVFRELAAARAELNNVKGDLEPTVLSLAFVFLLVGYGTKVGLVPLHNWLPDAHAEGPTPVSAVLSGLLLNVALYAVVRCKVLVEASAQTSFARELMMGFGLLSVVVAAFLLSRQKDIKRLFAYSSIEHMGIITFAFGMGGPIANFAGMLHMTVHSLTKSAIFFAVGHATQKAGTQLIDGIRGLITLSPMIGWALALGSLAILGMPPFGVFASEFLILTTAMRDHPWATPFLLIALAVAFAAVFSKVQPMVFGEPNAQRLPHRPALIPVYVHLGLVLMLGLWIPPYLAEWYRQAARLIG